MGEPPPDPKYLLRGDMGCVHSLLFWITPKVEHLYAGCASGDIHIWDLKKNRRLTCFTSGTDPCLAMHTINDDSLLTQQKCGTINIYKASESQWTLYNKLNCDYPTFCRCQMLSQDSALVSLRDSNVGIYSLKSCNIEKTLESSEVPSSKKLGEVMAIKPLATTDHKVLIAYEIGLLALWDLKEEKVLNTLEIESYPMALDFDILFMRGLIGGPSEKVEIFEVSVNDTLSHKRTIMLKSPGTSVTIIKPDSKVCVIGNWDGRLRIFSWKTLKQLAVLDHHRNTIHDVIYSKSQVNAYDSKCLMAAAGKDGYVSLWDIYN